MNKSYRVTALCFRCGKRQDILDMRKTHVGVYVCFDKSQCPGMKSPIKSL